MTRSAPRNLSRLGRGPQRTVVTSNGKARLAVWLIWLAVAITSWVMAAPEARQPWISTTVTRHVKKSLINVIFDTRIFDAKSQ